MIPSSAPLRFILVSMFSHKRDRQVVESEIAEAKALIETYGGTIALSLTQNESHYAQSTYIGRGKTEEIAFAIETDNIDVVVINDNLSSSQLYALQGVLGEYSPNLKVWDRTGLILQIFKQHASTAEAKLQIKLAYTKHRGPELQGMGKQMSQQGAGIGTRGQGETNTEVMKRHFRGEISQIEEELEKIVASRKHQMDHRKRLNLPTISIVGYTNAGKSTLFNLLTKKNNLVQDAPFATLDSTVGKLYLHGLQKESFISDTIGFIQNLPTELIDAFQSTLMETVNADLLLHVVDISDEFLPEKIETVNIILSNLGIADKKRVFIFNKVDALDAKRGVEIMARLKEKYAEYSPLFISASTGYGHEELIRVIEENFA
jgi:GTP-binding protein HflX